MQVDPRMLEILVCPLTKVPLVYDALTQELISPQAKRAFPIRNGIPVIVLSHAREIDS